MPRSDHQIFPYAVKGHPACVIIVNGEGHVFVPQPGPTKELEAELITVGANIARLNGASIATYYIRLAGTSLALTPDPDASQSAVRPVRELSLKEPAVRPPASSRKSK